jgi:hypothetical protein
MQNILGISLKTKHLGLAVLYDGELADFRVRTFYGAWTVEKRGDMLRTIRKTVDRYGIAAIVLKAPQSFHCSNSILDILRDIERLAEQSGIKLSICTIDTLTKRYSGNGRGTRRTLIEAIVAKYPDSRQLARLYEKERNNRNAYHVKIFEAIACAELALGTGQ